MYVLELQEKTLFIKLKDVFPECEILIEGSEYHPLFCLTGPCYRNSNCMGKLAVRVNYIFEQWPKAELILLYFSYPDRPGSQRAGLFWKDMREPRYITMNRTGWQKIKTMGTVFQWQMPDELYLATEGTVPQSRLTESLTP